MNGMVEWYTRMNGWAIEVRKKTGKCTTENGKLGGGLRRKYCWIACGFKEEGSVDTVVPAMS